MNIQTKDVSLNCQGSKETFLILTKLNAIERKQQTRWTRMEQVEEMMTKELAEMINMECGYEMIELE